MTSMSLFINVVRDGGRKVKTNGAFIFPGDFVSGARQKPRSGSEVFMEPKVSLFHGY